MAWAVQLPDGSIEKFDTFEAAEDFRKEMEAADTRTPEEIYDQHPRPHVARDVFLKRMAEGWSPHRAVDTPPEGRFAPAPLMRENRARIAEKMGAPTAKMYEAFGRSRTMRQWSESCQIDPGTLHKGAARHGTLEAYFEHIGWHPTKAPNTTVDLEDPDTWD